MDPKKEVVIIRIKKDIESYKGEMLRAGEYEAECWHRYKESMRSQLDAQLKYQMELNSLWYELNLLEKDND